MKIGIFGGSFNPVHLGHFTIVEQLLAIGKVDRVLVVPSFQNPLKADVPVTPLKVRLKMLKETFQALENVEILDYEVKRQELSYTLDTLSYLKGVYPNDSLHLVMGEDSFEQLDQWKNPEQILKLAKLLVFYRPAQRGSNHGEKMIKYKDRVEWVKVTIPDISATEIRNMPIEAVQREEKIHPNAIKTWEIFKNDE